MLHTIVIKQPDIVFVRRWVVASIANTVFRILGVGNIEKDANYAIAIEMVPLANHVICMPDSVYAAKALLVDDVISVRPVTLAIRHVNDAIVIGTVQWRPMWVR